MRSLTAPDRRATMRATVEAQDLKRALDRIKPAVDSRSASLPARSVLIDAGNGMLVVCAANGDVTIRTLTRSEVSGAGSVLVPFARLHTVLGRLRGALALEIDDPRNGSLVLTAGSTRAQLDTSGIVDFPGVTFSGSGPAVPLEIDALRRVLPAVSTDQSRPALCAVLLDGADVVATDSYRLHLERVTDPLPRCLLPGSTLARIAATRHCTLDVRVDETAGLAELTVAETEYIVRTVPGKWVDYKQVIPQPADIRVVATVSSEDLLKAADQLRPLTTSGSPEPAAWLTLAPGRMTVAVGVDGVGRGEIEIPADVYGVGRIEHVAFNLAFLAACVRACGADRVSIHLQDARKAAVVVGEGADWGRSRTGLRLLMPVNLPRPADIVAFAKPVPAAPAEAAVGQHDQLDNVVPLRGRRDRRITRRRAGR